jgi:hypothetical protein
MVLLSRIMLFYNAKTALGKAHRLSGDLLFDFKNGTQCTYAHLSSQHIVKSWARTSTGSGAGDAMGAGCSD